MIILKDAKKVTDKNSTSRKKKLSFRKLFNKQTNKKTLSNLRMKAKNFDYGNLQKCNSYHHN